MNILFVFHYLIILIQKQATNLRLINNTSFFLSFLLRELKTFSKVFILDRFNAVSTQILNFFEVSKQAFKNSTSSLHFRNTKSIFPNILTSLTTVFPYFDRKTYAMDVSIENLSLTKNSKTKGTTFNIHITILVVTS